MQNVIEAGDIKMAPQYFYAFDMAQQLGFTDKCLGVYKYGSSIYGTKTEKSDLDLVFIADTEKEIYEVLQSKDFPFCSGYTEKVDLHYISKESFIKLLNEHDFMVLEVYYQMRDDERLKYPFNLNLDTLRRSVSAVCSNSWSKARKKLDIPEEDDYIALKSLFHSIRILSYGIDIAQDGIIDFKNVLIDGEKISCSNFWHRIQQKYESGWRWAEFKKKYTPLQNSNATLFRLLAPKIDKN